MSPRSLARLARSFSLRSLALSIVLGLAWPAAAQQSAEKPLAKEPAADDKALEQRIADTLSAVVRVRMRAVPDARSNATLGPTREGSGVVIEPDYVLTIGYLVIEPDAIEVTAVTGRTLPATLAGYDHASGFGLLKVQGDLQVKPIVLGDSAAAKVREPMIVVPFGGREAASLAYVMSRRQFAGSWEYLLDSAIFTSPPTMTWAGAALVNRELRLVGVGSLLVGNAEDPAAPQPGNMFVPVDLLKPILADLKANGRAAGPQRPWLGVNTEEVQGRLLVSRVQPEGPAARAGLRRGDVIVGVADVAVKTHADLYRKLWSLGAAGVEVPLKVLQDGDVRELKVKSIDRFEYFKGRQTY
jgi:S1-C subfamily serine protease